MDAAGVSALLDAIKRKHKLTAKWLASVSVREVFGGEGVWAGEVQVFTVEHSKAKRCYAWSYLSHPGRGGRMGKRRKVHVVLGIGPIVDAATAVRAVIAATGGLPAPGEASATDAAELDAMAAEIEHKHRLVGRWVQSVPVVFGVVVEVFAVGHSEAQYAYAWSERTQDGRPFQTVLGIPPITSAGAAVRWVRVATG